MKLVSKEEEDAHYRETLKGGFIGGMAGLALGTLGVYAGIRRYPAFRSLTPPIRVFLVTSSGTAASIITADHYSSVYQAAQHPDSGFKDITTRAREASRAQESQYERFLDWGKTNRYKIVGASWAIAMIVSLSLTGRNPYLSTQQKVVQSRVYAQFLTIGIIVATAVFEIGDQRAGESRWEGKGGGEKGGEPGAAGEEVKGGKVMKREKREREQWDGEDQWRDMVEAEEERQKKREEKVHEIEERKRTEKGGKGHKGHKEHHEEGDKHEKSQKKGEGDGNKVGEDVQKRMGKAGAEKAKGSETH